MAFPLSLSLSLSLSIELMSLKSVKNNDIKKIKIDFRSQRLSSSVNSQGLHKLQTLCLQCDIPQFGIWLLPRALYPVGPFSSPQTETNPEGLHASGVDCWISCSHFHYLSDLLLIS